MKYTLILLALIGGAFSEILKGKRAFYDKVDYNGDEYGGNVCVGVGQCNKARVRNSKLVPVPHSCIALCRNDYKDTCASAYFDPKTRHCHLLKERCTKAELTSLNSGSIYFYRRKATETGCPDLGDAPGYDCKTQPADIVFALDNSGSISGSDYIIMMNFVKNLVRLLDVSPTTKQIGIITFGQGPQLRFRLNAHDNQQALIAAIQAIRRQTDIGRTNTGAALELARDVGFLQSNGGRKNVMKVVIVITDGVSNTGPAPIPQANKLRQDGAVVIAVGVGVGGGGQAELKGIAGPTNVLSAKSFTDLDALKERLIQATCTISPPRIYSDVYCTAIGKKCPGKNMYLNNPWKCRTRKFCADKCSRIVECGMFDWRPKKGEDVTSIHAIGTCYHKIKPCTDEELVDDPKSRNYRRLLKTDIEQE